MTVSSNALCADGATDSIKQRWCHKYTLHLGKAQPLHVRRAHRLACAVGGVTCQQLPATEALQHALCSYLAQAFCAVLCCTVSIPTVQISDVGGLALGDALKHTLCLRRLNLNHNHLSSSTFTSIADAISVQAGTALTGGRCAKVAARIWHSFMTGLRMRLAQRWWPQNAGR